MAAFPEILRTGSAAVILMLTLLGADAQTVESDSEPAGAAAVAPADPGHAGDSRAGPPAYLQQLAHLRQIYADNISSRQFSEAIVTAKELVQLAIDEHGRNNVDTAAALTDLGYAQSGDEDFDSAILNFRASIELTKQIENHLAASLVDPLRGLADAYMKTGRPDKAIETLNLAVHINNVNEGPLNLDQIDLLEDMSNARADAGDMKSALEVRDRIYQVSARAHGAGSAAILPTLRSRAIWSHGHGLFHEEQNIYREMIRIAGDELGRDDLELIQPLTGLAYSYLYADSTWRLDRRFLSSITSGENFLKRALRIAREHPEADWRNERDALLALGDYYLFTSNLKGARRQYLDAWKLLSGDQEKLNSRTEALQQPVRLQLVAPPKYVNAARGPDVPEEILSQRVYQRGHMTARFDITQEGRSENITIVESVPPGFRELEGQLLERIGNAVYRPRHEQGYPVRSDNLIYSHTFFYLESELPEEDRPATVRSQ